MQQMRDRTLLGKIEKMLGKMIAGIFLGIIIFYRYCFSPWMPPACRYYPSCSIYGKQAIAKYGLYGVYLFLRRLLRCHPLSKGGVDFVP